MSNLSIFKESGAVSTASKRELTGLAKTLAATSNMRRIATNTNGTFKRVVNGEQVGKAIRGEFNAIIVAMLAKPGREFYGSDYDPDAKGTLPDCYSNLGDKPEAASKNRQAANCTNCPNNIDGSGKNGKGKACRFKRKIALLLEGDDSGEVYQFNVPAKSLFGKGNGNVHPYESYCRFLAANGTGPDRVVTTIAYNLDAETMEINFTADRFITEEELAIVQAAQDNPATQRLIQITAAEADGVKPAAKAEEEAPKAAIKPASEVVVKKLSFMDDDDEEEEVEVEAPKAKRTAKKEEPVKASGDLASIVNAWADDEDEED